LYLAAKRQSPEREARLRLAKGAIEATRAVKARPRDFRQSR
jgi:hypothetical protein